jgi:leucyl-tRNA synthetase
MILAAAPIIPHLAEECWKTLGHKETLIIDTSWPVADLSLLIEDMVTIVVHVNGKSRSKLVISSDASNKEIENAAYALEKVKQAIEGRAIRKVIVVPRKIVNIVV